MTGRTPGTAAAAEAPEGGTPMLCQYCGKNPASTQISIVWGGKLTEYALCSECAQRLGYGNLFTAGPFGDLAGEFFDAPGGRDGVRCQCCGSSFRDIVRSGRAGCAECYRTFYDRLLPVIRRMHGSVAHRGKIPGKSLPQVRTGGPLAVRGPGGEKKQ